MLATSEPLAGARSSQRHASASRPVTIEPARALRVLIPRGAGPSGQSYGIARGYSPARPSLRCSCSACEAKCNRSVVKRSASLQRPRTCES
jgi:hypothetical protein